MTNKKINILLALVTLMAIMGMFALILQVGIYTRVSDVQSTIHHYISIPMVDETDEIENETEDVVIDAPSEDLGADYVSMQEWPPEEVPIEHAGCFEENKITIHDEQFCLWTTSEGAAGHNYVEYTYNPLDENEGHAHKIVVRFVSDCNIYEGEAMERCEQEKASFDPDEFFYKYYQSLNE